jgi:hypothetical protein
MVEHQYPVYLQCFTQGSIPPVFSLILHDGLMASPSGSETHTRPPTLLRVAVAVAACCALYLWDFGRRVRSSPSHSNCSLDGVWFSSPVSCATHSRSCLSSRRLWCLSLSLYDLELGRFLLPGYVLRLLILSYRSPSSASCLFE